MPPQHRGHLAGANLEARLQETRRLPERQSSRLPRRVPPVHVAVPGTQSFRARAAGGGWHAHQGGQQQGPQLYEELAGEVHQGGGQASGRISAAPRRERCRGSRDRRLAHQKPRGEDRGAAREARAIRGAAAGTGAERRGSLTDPDRPAMAAHPQGRRPLQYPGRRRREEQMIVDQVVTNQVVDMGLLRQTAESASAILAVETIDVVADLGYFKIEDIEACEKAGMTPCVPKPQRGSSVSNGFFRKDEFRYGAERDAFICPAGQVLSTRYESKLRELTKI